MSILQDKLAALLTDTSISSRIRAWIKEATVRIEGADTKMVALTKRVEELEKPSPVPAPTPAPAQAPAPTTFPNPPVGPFTEINGGGTKDSGIFTYNPAGQVIEKLHVSNMLSYGVGAMVWPAKEITTPVTIRDCIIEDVSRVVPKSSDGTAEACLWVGNKAVVNRVRLRRGAWMGMWTGAACFDSVFEDIEVAECPIALYIEHQTKRCVFRNCSFRAVDNAVNIEWWYTGQGSNSITFENCRFHSDRGWGMFIDAGTYDIHLVACTFTGAKGLTHPTRLVQPLPNTWDAATDFSGVAGTKILAHSNAVG